MLYFKLRYSAQNTSAGMMLCRRRCVI